MALDDEAKRRGSSRSEALLEAVRTQIIRSGPAEESNAADPDSQIHGSGSASAGSNSGTAEIHGSQPRPPRYRGRALLLAAAVGAILGSCATLLVR